MGGGKLGVASRNLLQSLTHTLMWLVLFVSILDAQTNQFFTPIYPADTQLTANQLAAKQIYQNSPFTKSLQLVQLGNLPQIQQDGIVPLFIPGNSRRYEFAASHVESTAGGDYVWMGELITRDSCNGEVEEQQCLAGFLRVLKQSEKVFGEVQIDTAYYDIRHLGEGLSALVELDADEFIPPSGTGCATPEEPSGMKPVFAAVASDRTDICPVRAAVLYTQAAMDARPDILDIINLSITSVNQSFRYSDIDNSELTIVLAGTQLLTTAQFTSSADILDDVYSLVANNTVAAVRAAMHADIVIVMTDAAYSDYDGAVTTFGDFPTASDSAFAIVEVQAANHPNYSFHHEVAHLFGTRHQNSDNCHKNHDDSGLSYAHGYVFEKGCHCLLWDNKKYYHTIVSACYDNGQRQKIPHYSNPNVKYNGKKTGTAPTNNNAKVLRDAACRVSNYVLTDVPWVWISGFNRMCPEEINYIGAEIEGIPGPYEYEWFVSDDGFDWGLPVSTAIGFSLEMPAEPGKKVFIKLIAGHINGPKDTAFKTVRSDTSDMLCFRGRLENKGQTPASSLQIFPNPVTLDALTVRWQGNNKGPNTVSIFDSFGREVGKINRQVAEEENEINLNVAHLSNGVYWLRLRSQTFDKTLRFALVR